MKKFGSSTDKIEETYLFQEIHDQPAALSALLENEKASIQELARAIRQWDVTHIIIAARGTSDNAARYAQYVLGANNHLTVALATPSLFSIYGRPPKFGNALILGISQSGKSPDIIAVLEEAKRQGRLTAVITNNAESELAATGDIVIKLNAGQEFAVAATKTYTNSLAAIAMLSAQLTGEPEGFHELERLPDSLNEVLGMGSLIDQIAPRYRYMQHCVIIGRGYNYATAFEMALKMKELTYTIVEPYSSADFLHGPMALIEKGFPVVIIAPNGMLKHEMTAFLERINARQAESIVISDVPEILNLARIPLPLPSSVPEWVSPLSTIIPGQLFSMYLAAARDFDVDSPRGLRKVTKTR